MMKFSSLSVRPHAALATFVALLPGPHRARFCRLHPAWWFTACAAVASAADGAIRDFGRETESALSPNLMWIAGEKIRAGYNYNASTDHYPIAKASGMNTIISRLEIANDPGGDVALLDTLTPAARKPDALQSYEMIEPSSRLAKKHGLHWLFMLNLAASTGNYDDGVRDNSRRFNNGKLPAPTDEIYWTRVVENRFLRVAEMLQGDAYQIDGFLIDPEMYALGGATPPGLDVGDYALGQFLAAEDRAIAFKQMSIRAR